MKFTKKKWNDWEVVKCETGSLEMLIGISAGPRIVSVGQAGGTNLLYKDSTNFQVGDWRIYGGHRLTIAPENADSYYPDNDPCEVEIENSILKVSSKQRSSGIRLSMVVSENAAPGTGFTIKHVIENNGKGDWSGALWAITCVPRSSIISAFCEVPDLHFWPGTDPSNWQQANNHVTIKPGNYRGKAGWYNNHVLLTSKLQEGSLKICSLQASAPNSFDKSSNVEIFVCPAFVELETLSGDLIVHPGQSASHLQQWQIQSN